MTAPATEYLIAHITIPGAPVTKKTSQALVWVGKGPKRRPKIVPSARSKRWEGEVSAALHVLWRRPALTNLVWVRALFYRPTETTGDLSNYLQALGDALERGGVVANDRLIASWDGSRRLVDADDPRVEVDLLAFGD